MKKVLVALAAVSALSAIAGDYVSLSVENDKSRVDRSNAVVETVRANKDIGAGFNIAIQDRTQVENAGGMFNSVEGTVGYQVVSPLNVYLGAGRDQGLNGGKDQAYNYGLVGFTAGVPVGPTYAFAGAKTHANWDKDAPKQTVAYAGVSLPVTKTFAVEVGGSASFQDIKDKAYGITGRVSF